ncbi:hypothetical protein RYX36_009560, partial [Vicia faba]
STSKTITNTCSDGSNTSFSGEDTANNSTITYFSSIGKNTTLSITTYCETTFTTTGHNTNFTTTIFIQLSTSPRNSHFSSRTSSGPVSNNIIVAPFLIFKNCTPTPPTYILKDVSLTAYPSEILAIVGPSDAGKSTLQHSENSQLMFLNMMRVFLC